MLVVDVPHILNGECWPSIFAILVFAVAYGCCSEWLQFVDGLATTQTDGDRGVVGEAVDVRVIFLTSVFAYQTTIYSSICKLYEPLPPLGVGCFAGKVNVGETLFKNYYNTESKIMQGEADVTVDDENATKVYLTTLQSREFLVDTLGWNTEVWEVVDGQYPTLAANK